MIFETVSMPFFTPNQQIPADASMKASVRPDDSQPLDDTLPRYAPASSGEAKTSSCANDFHAYRKIQPPMIA